MIAFIIIISITSYQLIGLCRNNMVKNNQQGYLMFAINSHIDELIPKIKKGELFLTG